MSELQPLIQDDVVLDIDEPVLTPELYTMQAYQALVADPPGTLRDMELSITITALPVVDEGVETDLWFAADRGVMAIDANCQLAYGTIGAQSARSAIQKKMVVSRMRPYSLTGGTQVGERWGGAAIVDAGTLTADLWVTEVQTGCTVLALDWGGGRYSMVHLQPSDDGQFNWLGRKVMGLDSWTEGWTRPGLFRGLYKNTWLSREMKWVVDSTGETPQRYIMVQSMLQNLSGKVTQVIGVRSGRSFDFYRQIPINLQTRRAEALRWSTWYSLVPFLPY